MKHIKNILSKIWKFIYIHPIWTIVISWLTFYIIHSLMTGTPNPAGDLCLIIFVFALVSPFIRNARIRERKKQEAEYLAKQIALEQDKLNNPDKYNN